MTIFNHAFADLQPWVQHYGAAVIFLILTLESLGLPLPGETLLIAGAILAGRGEIALPVLFLSAWGGAVIGDNIGYLIGRLLGHKLLWRYGEKVWLKPDRLRKVEAAFARYGPATVGFARFVNVLRQLNGLVAGTLEMHWWSFLLFNALGGALWVAVWTAVGHYFGTHEAAIAAVLHKLGLFGAIAAALVLIAVVIHVVLHRKRRP